MLSTFNEVKIFSGQSSRYLAEQIAEYYGQPLGEIIVQRFKDGEFQLVINESVRGSYVFYIQSTFPPTDNLMELLMFVDAAKRASAGYICVVIPYFGFARQDRKDRPRVSITSKLVANLLTAAGADRVMTMDLHADQIQGFFDIPVDHLSSTAVYKPYIQKLEMEHLTFATPDVGGTKRARSYSQYFENSTLVICDKFRKKANEVAEMTLIGNVVGRNVILVDDIIDTGNTLCKAAKIIMDEGALSVRAICTHAVLSGDAYENIEKSSLTEVIVTDTIPLRKTSEKIKVLSVSQLFGKSIRHAHEFKSINSLFIK